MTPLVEMLLEERLKARAAKDWAASDRIRDGLAAAGIRVKDGKEGADMGVGMAPHLRGGFQRRRQDSPCRDLNGASTRPPKRRDLGAAAVLCTLSAPYFRSRMPH